MSSLKKEKQKEKQKEKSHSVKECSCKGCQFTKSIGYYYPEYVVELTEKINKLDVARNKEIKEIELEIKKGNNVSSLNLEIKNIKKNYDFLINSISEGYFYYNSQKK